MSGRISLEETRKVAALARLTLTDDEVARMQRELDAILDSMTALANLDTGDVPPTHHALEMSTPLRTDVVQASLSRNEILRAAAKNEAFGFAVPRVMEGE